MFDFSYINLLLPGIGHIAKKNGCEIKISYIPAAPYSRILIVKENEIKELSIEICIGFARAEQWVKLTDYVQGLCD